MENSAMFYEGFERLKDSTPLGSPRSLCLCFIWLLHADDARLYAGTIRTGLCDYSQS